MLTNRAPVPRMGLATHESIAEALDAFSTEFFAGASAVRADRVLGNGTTWQDVRVRLRELRRDFCRTSARRRRADLAEARRRRAKAGWVSGTEFATGWSRQRDPVR